MKERIIAPAFNHKCTDSSDNLVLCHDKIETSFAMLIIGYQIILICVQFTFMPTQYCDAKWLDLQIIGKAYFVL